MNRILPVLLAVLASARKSLDFGSLNAPPSSRTPRIPKIKHYSQMRARVPNDGGWHMKFNRSRV